MPRSQGINSQIINIAWPAIVSNITTPLLGLVDTAIAGHLGSAVYLGAIALGSTIFSLIYWLFGFLRMGTTGIAAQAFGAHDFNSLALVLKRSFGLAWGISVLLIILSPFICGPLLSFLDADDACQPLAAIYFRILIWGSPAVMMTYVLNGWMVGMQNTRLPMQIAIFTNVLNICISAVLVFIFRLKIEVIAIGTLTSQWCAVLIYLLAVRKTFRSLRHDGSKQTFFSFRKLFGINADIFFRTLCMVGVTAWFTRAGSSQGVEVLSANSILMQLFLFFSYFSDGFAYAGEAVVGKYAGKRIWKMVKSVVQHLLYWGAGLAIAFSLLYFLCGEYILLILTDRHDVVDVAKEYLPWAVAVPLSGIVAFIYDGVYIGLTRTKWMLVSVASATLLYFLCFFIFARIISTNHALWLSFVIYLVSRGIILHLAFSRQSRQISGPHGAIAK